MRGTLAISRILQFVCAGVVAIGAILLLIAIHHGTHVGFRDLSYHYDKFWDRERAAEPAKPGIRAQLPSHYIVRAQPTPAPTPCQECLERRERYRAAELNPQILIKKVENTLVLPQR